MVGEIHLWSLFIRFNFRTNAPFPGLLGPPALKDGKKVHVLAPLLCSLALAPRSPVRSLGDLIWRWAPSCEHGAQWPGHARLVAPPLPVISSCHPAIQLGRARPCARTAGFRTFRLTRPGEHAWLQGDHSAQASLLGRASHHVGGAISGALGHPTLLSAQNLPLLHPQLAYHGDRTDTIINASL